MTDVASNYRRLMERIQVSAERCGRDPHEVRLIAVTKSVSVERIREGIECGISEIGENRLQEALAKKEALQDVRLIWHFIGHLQTNKVKKVVGVFDCIHSIDRADLAEKLNQHAGSSRLPVLIEVKLHAEATKSGVDETHLAQLVDKLRASDHLDLRGLMAVPPFIEDPDSVRPYFRRLRELARRFELQELSMGMSHDYEVAVEEGATMVRVGTALFGSRQ